MGSVVCLHGLVRGCPLAYRYDGDRSKAFVRCHCYGLEGQACGEHFAHPTMDLLLDRDAAEKLCY